jgi:V-type H+-transporting ATPase proteolipid subunit
VKGGNLTPCLRLTSIQPFFGAVGCAIAIIFANFGASYGMAKAGVGIMSSGVLRPDLLIRSK